MWTKDFPKVRGMYWFYGCPFGYPKGNLYDYKKLFLFIVTACNQNEFDGHYVCKDGFSVYVEIKEDNANGVWLKLEPPEFPKEQ